MVTTSLGTAALCVHTSLLLSTSFPFCPLFLVGFGVLFSLGIVLPFTPQPWSAGSRAELCVMVRGGMLWQRSWFSHVPRAAVCHLAVLPQPW